MAYNPRSGVPLGGIGAGRIDLCPDGAFRNVTTHNNIDIPFSSLDMAPEFRPEGIRHAFLAVQTANHGAKILKTKDDAFFPCCTAEEIKYEGYYPRALMSFAPLGPVEIGLEAFSPLLLDEEEGYKNSSLPAIAFMMKVRNAGTSPECVSVAFSWPNIIGRGGYPGALINDARTNITGWEEGANREYLRFYHLGAKVDRRLEGHYALTLANKAEGMRSWYVGTWKEDLWKNFAAHGTLPNEVMPGQLGAAGDYPGGSTGMLCCKKELGAGETWNPVFVLSWFFPNKTANLKPEINYRNAYTKWFADAAEVAGYFSAHLADLHKGTLRWQDRINRSNLPDWLKLKLINNLFPLSTGGYYTADGRFSSNESPTDMAGCMGTIDQRCASDSIYNMCFPALSRSELKLFGDQQITETHPQRYGPHWDCNAGTYTKTLDRVGAIRHEVGWDELEAGRLGSKMWTNLHWPDLTSAFVLQCYRQIIWTGDRAFLEYAYPKVKQALQFQKRLDQNGDGIADLWGPGCCTYDNHNFPYFGASSFVASMYLAATAAAKEMARLMGDTAYAKEMEQEVALTRKTMEEKLWDEKLGYFLCWRDENAKNWDRSERKHDDRSESCMVAQVAGTWFAHLLNLDELLRPDLVKRALGSIYERDVKPIKYCAANEVWPNGKIAMSWPFYIETYFAANSIYEGKVDEALDMERRFYNAAFEKTGLPWEISLIWGGPDNGEPSWGKWYMTNPCSWYLPMALTGFHYNALKDEMRLAPRFGSELKELKSIPVFMPGFWAAVSAKPGEIEFSVDRMFNGNGFPLRKLILESVSSRILLNGKPVKAESEGPCRDGHAFNVELELKQGDVLTIKG